MFGSKAKKVRGEAAKEIRHKDLSAPASEVAPEGVDTTQVWLAVIEVSKPESTISYVSFANGDTSEYYTKGKGLEGLGDVEAVNEASRAFVEAASARFDMFDTASDYPLPTAGMVRFYCRKGDETFTVEVLEDIASVGGHPLTALYRKGLDVIKQVQGVETRR